LGHIGAVVISLVHLTAALATGQSTAARFFISVKTEKDGAEPQQIVDTLARLKAAGRPTRHGRRDVMSGSCEE
jgi:hypothetical protein